MDISALQQHFSISNPTSAPKSSHCALNGREIIGGWSMQNPLGKGRFATVWSAQDAAGASVAIKVYRSGGDNIRYYKNEVKILNKLCQYAQTMGQTRNIVGYRGIFAHIEIGADLEPSLHPCIIFDKAGDTLSRLIKFYKREHDCATPKQLATKIMQHIFTGLAYMHRAGIIHTDIKPANILLSCHVGDIGAGSTFTALLADLGSSTPADDIFTESVGTTQYMAPELIIAESFDTSMDIWASYVMFFELLTGDLLFDVYNECDISYGDDADGEALEWLKSESAVSDGDGGIIMGTSSTTVSSGSSGSEEEFDEEQLNYRHLLLITKVLGYPPEEFMHLARSYYTRLGKLKNHPDLEPITLAELLYSNYDFEPQVCDELAEFLLTGLRYIPANRITAEQAIIHPFIQQSD